MKEKFLKLAAAGKLPRQAIPALVALTSTGYAMHRSWGFGRIRRIDTVMSRMVIDFKGKPDHIIDLAFAAQILKPATIEDEARMKAPSVQHLNWKLLPPGEAGLAAVRQYVRDAARRQSTGSAFDISRLEFLLKLRPIQIFAGLDEFDGYLAFQFANFSGAVLENPIEGNAIYIFGQNWRELSKFSKSELFQEKRRNFRRIVHSGDWQNRVRNAIRRSPS